MPNCDFNKVAKQNKVLKPGALLKTSLVLFR